LLDHETLHPHARRSIRVSIGHSLKLNINQSLNSIGDLQLLKDRGYKLVAATLTDNSISLGKHQFNEKNVLILGSEGFGVKENILKICDLEVNIPISTDVDSLNVACASSILLHQFSVDTFN
jgi:tRNA G18 (ribose-2'-O)-methylase SpoU